MNTYVPLNMSYKVTAQLDGNNNIVPGTIKLYGEDAQGNYIPAEYFKGYSDSEVEQQSYEATKIHLDNYSKQSASSLSPSYVYDGGAALNYAVRWTYDYPDDVDCKDGKTHQDRRAYNNSWYDWIRCNDCANYVSQALHAGGLQMDSTWHGYPDELSYTWRYIPALEDYMVDNGYWHSTNWAGLQSGGVIEQTDQGHVMMCIYNDGSLMEYAAHTSDKKYWSWPSSWSAYYWNVS